MFFREPDSGTVFEVGFAHALGKPVAAVLAMDGRYDMLIEDFGGPLNLMLSESCRVFHDAALALDWLAASTVGSTGR